MRFFKCQLFVATFSQFSAAVRGQPGQLEGRTVVQETKRDRECGRVGVLWPQHSESQTAEDHLPGRGCPTAHGLHRRCQISRDLQEGRREGLPEALKKLKTTK